MGNKTNQGEYKRPISAINREKKVGARRQMGPIGTVGVGKGKHLNTGERVTKTKTLLWGTE